MTHTIFIPSDQLFPMYFPDPYYFMNDIYPVNQILKALSNLVSMDSQSSSALKFASLMQQKRNPADEAAQQRRLSQSEMQPKAGFLGNMWNRYDYLVPPSLQETMNADVG